ncbi:hypothetical protein EYF80_026542 [Liparis tanakae]|uniref:Uncharacterized protein n=1 Tax=Liparis tanakae TaxID=230148 RepID=A0A4Z2HBK5_9TELE|nr:hypothetical protein EYF80_026542 [Liparis tanakae]
MGSGPRVFTMRKEYPIHRLLQPGGQNLSNQGSLKNHFLKEFLKEPIEVHQTKEGFFSRTTEPLEEPPSSRAYLLMYGGICCSATGIMGMGALVDSQ